MTAIIIKKRPLGLFLFILFYSFIWSQTVSDIHFIGLNKTKEYVIKREVLHPVDVSLDSTLAKADRDRIDNLGIFSEVEWKAVPLENGSIVLQFNVTESWNNIKGAMPMYTEEYGWSVSGGYIVKNFRGRNQTLELGGSLGGQNTYGFRFNDPWIFGDHVSAELGVGKSINDHLFLDVVKKVTSLSVSMGRYFGKYIRSKLEIEIENKVFEDEKNYYKTKYNYIGLIGSVGYDSRDLYSNPGKGLKENHVFYYQIDQDTGVKNRFVWNHSFSVFHSLIPGDKKLVLGFNISNQFSLGDTNAVWMDYIGGSYSVRGWKMPSRDLYQSGKQPFRFGHHWVQSSIELRQVIIPKHATKYGNEIGLDFGLFLDVGINAIKLNNLINQTPLFGTGFGLRIPMPMMGALRLDYGWAFYEGKYVESSFHLAMGHRF